MDELTQALHTLLSEDATLTALLNTYGGQPAIFTVDPAPGDASLPYIITAGAVADNPFDTKTTLGRTVVRDVRCYTADSGSASTVERIAKRVRQLLHRQTFEIEGFVWIMASCSGPIQADEQDAYGRIVTVTLTMEEL